MRGLVLIALISGCGDAMGGAAGVCEDIPGEAPCCDIPLEVVCPPGAGRVDREPMTTDGKVTRVQDCIDDDDGDVVMVLASSDGVPYALSNLRTNFSTYCSTETGRITYRQDEYTTEVGNRTCAAACYDEARCGGIPLCDDVR